MSRPYTETEIRDEFITHIVDMIDFWETVNRNTWREKMEGLAFSILALLDGESVGVPAFKVIPNPHPEDLAYHIERGENWYPDDVDIAGCLHERWHPLLKERN